MDQYPQASPKPKRYVLRAALITALAYILLVSLPVIGWFATGLMAIVALTSSGEGIVDSLDVIMRIYVVVTIIVSITMLAMNVHYVVSKKITGAGRITIVILTALYFLFIALGATMLYMLTAGLLQYLLKSY